MNSYWIKYTLNSTKKIQKCCILFNWKFIFGSVCLLIINILGHRLLKFTKKSLWFWKNIYRLLKFFFLYVWHNIYMKLRNFKCSSYKNVYSDMWETAKAQSRSPGHTGTRGTSVPHCTGGLCHLFMHMLVTNPCLAGSITEPTMMAAYISVEICLSYTFWKLWYGFLVFFIQEVKRSYWN